jgi:hypothetical protein|tara:strand:+ start:789 stop:1307 length:519 start_codon:yes stop_codon:yes gene_type:complete
MKKEVSITLINLNPSNPRTVKSQRFKKMVKSVKEFPEMLEKRPIVVDESMTVLGGNMRLMACLEAGFKTVWIDVAEGWTEEQKREFIIKDNVSFGENDFDILANEWDSADLSDWGLEIWETTPDFDVDQEDQEKEKTIKLSYSEAKYKYVKDSLKKIAKSPEEALWSLLNTE